MEPTFFRYILRHSWRQQIFLLVLTVASFPFLYFSLELPKRIINDAIGATLFPREVLGREFSQLEYLWFLCLIFLVLVGIRFGLRYYVNVYKGQLGERMLRRLRYELFSRMLRFPLPHFRRASQGEMIAMMTGEVEPLGGFIGDAIALPAFEGGTLLTILFFMFMQDPVLGFAAIALFPVQIYVIPKLQRQINALAKERVRTVRKLSERIGEVVTGIEDVHAHDTSELERADFARWTGKIYDIRYKIYRKKFFVKFLNNVIGQITPFFFFSIGGYLVITGDLTFGALVAVLAAYKDVAAPWKEMLNWYQQKEDTRVKYEQLVEQFMPAGIMEDRLQALPDGPVPHLSGNLVASNLSYAEDEGIKVVDGISFSFPLTARVALVGREGSGHSVVAKLIARLLTPTTGSIRIGGTDLATLPESVTGRRLAYVGQSPAMFQGSLLDNLLYGLKHQPVRPAGHDGEAKLRFERYLREAIAAGTTTSDLEAHWIDDGSGDGEPVKALAEHIAAALDVAQLEPDIFGFGLQATFDPESRPELAESVLAARNVLKQRLDEPKYQGLVEPFDRDRYNTNMTVAENIMFGTPVGRDLDLEHIAENPYMRAVLEASDLLDEFLALGLQAARLTVELFRDVQPGDPIFERFSFVDMETLPDYQGVVRRADAVGTGALSPSHRDMLLALPFKLIPARHRLGLLDRDNERKLLQARQRFAEGLPAHLRGSVAFFDPARVNRAASVQDNILFGRFVYGKQQGQRAVGALIAEVIDGLGLRSAILDLGLEAEAGIAGSRLSAGQRTRLAIARAWLKRPDLLILDQATANLDAATHATIMRKLLDERGGAGLLWVLTEGADTQAFDREMVMEQGRLAHRAMPDQAAPRFSASG
ncbi:MAG: ATP-binding cassette domain-containing protein [Rhodospirillales bacterium]|nr:MAG: ATP-binding cassette domain-containing protein [Rhodospirillales bacterium]